MDFGRVLQAVLSRFQEQRIRYAALGGFALGLLGAPRATQDLDFLVHSDDLERVHQILTALGYERHFTSENASQYRSPVAPLGAIDILHALRTPSLRMLERTVERQVLDGPLTMRVLQPEDLIGFKVQAMANNPARIQREQVDIESLLQAQRGHLDWERIQQYYDIFNLGEEGRQLRQRYEVK